MKKTYIILFLCFFSFFVSCKSKDFKKSQSITINIVSEPQGLDPRTVRDLQSVNLIKTFFDGLLREAKDGTIKEALAESYSISEDGKTYTFILKDASWSNNDKITASDFEYTIKKTLSPSYISGNAAMLFIIKNAKKAKEKKISIDEVGINAIDEKTLVIELENPCPYFLKLLTSPIFFAVNKNVDQKNPKWAQDAKGYVSSGAFILNEWKHHDFIEAKKNENYWDREKVKLKKISMLMLTNTVEIDMFQSKELDLAGSPFSMIPVDSLQSLKKENNYFSKPYFGTSFIRINTQKVEDKDFRKALINAFDRDKITEHILQGDQIATTRLVPREKKENISNIKKDYSLKKMTLSYISSDRSHLLAQTIQRDFEKNLNVKVELIALERKTYYDRISTQNYDLALGSWIADFNDPINFLNVFKYKNSSSNNTFWENEKFTSLLNKSENISDPIKRDEILIEAENILLSDAPIIPICHLSQNYLINEKLKIKLYPSGFVDFKFAHLDEK